MKRYTVKKGRHGFRLLGVFPIIPKIIKRPILASWLVTFGEGCDYLLPGADQQDWNKGGGVSFDLLTNHIDSVMWAWRYNPALELVELAMYAHVDGLRWVARNELRPSEGEILNRIAIGETARISLKVDYEEGNYDMNIQVVGDNESYPGIIPFTHEKEIARTIGVWFGGNNPAPNKMDLFIERKVSK